MQTVTPSPILRSAGSVASLCLTVIVAAMGVILSAQAQ